MASSREIKVALASVVDSNTSLKSLQLTLEDEYKVIKQLHKDLAHAFKEDGSFVGASSIEEIQTAFNALCKTAKANASAFSKGAKAFLEADKQLAGK